MASLLIKINHVDPHSWEFIESSICGLAEMTMMSVAGAIVQEISQDLIKHPIQEVECLISS